METIHTGAAAITFPTTPEAFIAYQEQLADRKLAEHEREAIAAWVKVFNLFYEGGLKQDHAVLNRCPDKPDEFMSRHKDDSFIHQFAKACRFWMIEAWEQGAERSVSK